MPPNGRVIVGGTHGEEDPDRVAVSYITAGAALDHGKQVVMWLTSEGVRLALRRYVDPIRAELDPPVKRVHDPVHQKEGALLRVPDLLRRARPRRGRARRERRAQGRNPLMELAGEGAMTFTY